MSVVALRTTRAAALVCCALVVIADVAAAQSSIDRVRRSNGADSGQIAAVSPLGITISKGGVETKIPVEEIREISFGGEPRGLTLARQAAAAGRFAAASDALNTVDTASVPSSGVRRDGMLADIEYLKAVVAAQSAMAGGVDSSVAAAALQSFLANHGLSYRVPDAIELFGDLLLASGRAEQARQQYEKLAKANTPYFTALSTLLVGRSWQTEGEHATAIAQFDKVIAAAGASPALDALRLEAKLGKAVSEAAMGQLDQAIDAIARHVALAETDDAALLAQAYLALGDCYLEAERPRDATLAFLHVDLLYAEVPLLHARSLHELAKLWRATGYADRAEEAAQKLKDEYAGSRWTDL